MRKLITTIIVVLYGPVLFLSCTAPGASHDEVEQLKRRVTVLEQKVESMPVIQAGAEPVRASLVSSTPLYSNSSQCQATTKKGRQCKRKGKSNGYCWQHGG